MGGFTYRQLNRMTAEHTQQTLDSLENNFSLLDQILSLTAQEIETTYGPKLRHVADTLLDISIENLTATELATLRDASGLDHLFVVDAGGKVILTTQPEDMGLNLFALSEDLKLTLENLMGSGRLFTQSPTLSTVTNELVTFLYTSPENSHLIIEGSVDLFRFAASQRDSHPFNSVKRVLFDQRFNSNTLIQSVDIVALTSSGLRSYLSPDRRFSMPIDPLQQLETGEEIYFHQDNATTLVRRISRTDFTGHSIPTFAVIEYTTAQRLAYRAQMTLSIAAAALLLIIILGLINKLIIDRTLLSRIDKINEGIHFISEGRFDHHITIRGDDEINLIANAVNAMSATIEQRAKEIKQSEARFQTIFDNVSDAILVHSTEESNDIVDVNLRALELYDYSKEQFLQISIGDISQGEPPYSLTEAKQWMDKAVKGQNPGFEWLAKKRSGELFWTEIHMRTTQFGNDTFILVSIRDITERKTSEIALRESEENLRTTLNSIGDGVIATDTEGQITRMNPIAERLTGWSENEAIGLPLPMVFRLKSFQADRVVQSTLNQFISDMSTLSVSNETLLVSRNQQEYLISQSGAPIRDSANEVIGLVLVFRDITEERTLQERVRHGQKMEAIGQLSGGIAHDFNNMLGGIMGATQVLQSLTSPDPEQQKFFDIILRSVKRASELSEKLLTFARKQPMRETPCDPAQLLQDTVSILENTIDRRITLNLVLCPEKALIKGDPSQLQNCFLNLGINASQAITDGGEITIETSITLLDPIYCKASQFDLIPGRYLKIEFRDTGCGIAPENLSHIFEPFYTTKREHEGTGLGLAAVYGTVQIHHGAITVYSEPGTGTSFHLFFPLADTDESIAELNEAPLVKGTGLILVVDDEEMVRTTAKALLESLGYQVITAENGHEAIDLFETHIETIKLVILDMIMPEMNGKDCFDELRKRKPDIAVYIASGFTRDEDINAMLKKGLKGFIRKPYSVAELCQLITPNSKG
jgi:PAS domain S-box-containing protein